MSKNELYLDLKAKLGSLGIRNNVYIAPEDNEIECVNISDPIIGLRELDILHHMAQKAEMNGHTMKIDTSRSKGLNGRSYMEVTFVGM